MATKGGEIKYTIGFQIQQQNLKQLRASLQQLQKMKFSDLMKINNKPIQEARDILKDIQKDAGVVEDALNKAFNTKLGTVNIQEFNNILSKSGYTMASLQQSFSRGGATGQATFRKLANSVLNTNVQLKKSQTLIDKMASTLANTVRWNIASGAINTFTRSVEQAWGYVKNLDTSLNNIRIVTGKSSDQMARFAKQANEAAQQLGKTTTDYTNAALIYAQQGLSDEEVAARTAITLKTANVTGQSTADVSEQLTAVWNGYKVTAAQAEVYVDRLAAVAATTASDLQELSTGMSKVASAAAAMGVGEDQLAAQLSTIISATRQAPESVGTALRTVYARISDIQAGIDEDGVTLGHYSGKMAQLGFNVLDMNGKLRDMGQVMEEIGGRWQNLTRQQQINLAQTMAGQRQYNNLLALFDNFEKYNEALNTAQNATGTLQKQQDTYMESTRAHLDQLTAALENIYDSLINSDDLEGINSLIDALKDLANFTANWIDSLGGGIELLKTLGSIGTMVFSQKIGNAIINMQEKQAQAQQQAQFFADKEAFAKEQLDRGIENEYTRTVFSNQAFLNGAGSRIPTEDYHEISQNLTDFSQASGDLQKVNQKLKNTSQNLIDVANKSGVFKQKFDISDLDNPTKLDEMRSGLDKLKKSYEPVTEANEKFQKSYKQNIDAIFQGWGKGGVAALKEVQRETDNFVKSLNTVNPELGKTIFQDLPDEAKNAITEVQKYIKSLELTEKNPILTEQQKNELTKYYTEIVGAIGSRLKEIDQQVETVHGEAREKLEQQKKQLQKTMATLEDKTNRNIESARKRLQTQDITKAIGSILTLTSATRTFQNLGSIWNNQDLDTGEKFSQTLTNILSATLMVIPAITNLKGVISALGVAAKTTNWILVAITGAMALISWLGAAKKAEEELLKTQIQNNKKTIDEENKKQEQIEKNRELEKSLKELNNQYKEGKITRTELQTGIDDLIKQYGLQGAQANKLRDSYKDLTAWIKTSRAQRAKDAKESAGREKSNAESLLLSDSAIKNGGSIDGNVKYDLNVGSSQKTESDQIKSILKENGFEQIYDSFNLSQLGTGVKGKVSADDIVNVYEKVSETIKDIQNEITDSTQRSNSVVYNQLIKWRDGVRQQVEVYKKAVQDFQKYSAELALINLKINFDQTQTLNNYKHAREKLITEIRNDQTINPEGKMSDQQIENLADLTIRQENSEAFYKYNELANYTDEVLDHFHYLSKQAQQTLEGLDPSRFAFLMDYVDLDSLDSWREWESILKYAAEEDFSNLDKIVTPFEEASQQYNKYSSLVDQLQNSKNKTISKKQFGNLDAQIQSYFKPLANGQYQLVGSLKDFYNEATKLSVQAYRDNIDALKDQNEKIEQLKSTTRDKLTQSAAMPGGDWMQSDVENQFTYLQASGRFDTTQIKEWRAELWAASHTEGADATDTLQKIAEACADVNVSFQQLTETQKANVYQMYLNRSAMASSADSVEQLNKLLKEGYIYQEDYNQRLAEMHQSQRLDDLDLDSISDYADYLQDLANSSEDVTIGGKKLSKTLADNEQAAEDISIQIQRMNKAVNDLADNWENWASILKSSSRTSKQYFEASTDVKQALSDLLDISSDYINLDFIDSLAKTTEGMQLMQKAAKGDGDAIDQLRQRTLEDIVLHLDIANDDLEGNKLLSQVQSLQATLDSWGPISVGTEIGVDNLYEGQQAFIKALNNLITTAGLTKDQVNTLLSGMGYTGNFASQPQQIYYKEPDKYVTHHLVKSTGSFEVPAIGGMGGGKIETFDEYTTTEKIADGRVIKGEAPASSFITTEPGVTVVPKVNSITRKATGGANNYSSSNAGGPAPGKKSKSSGNKGGGGSSKSAQPDTSQKQLRKPLEDQRDIYHDINVQIDKSNRSLERLQKQQDKLYGGDLIKNLNQQSKQLERHKKLLEEKQKIQKQDIANQKEKLRQLGFEFDEYDNIANYMDVLEEKRAAANKAIENENALIAEYNKQTDKDRKKIISDQITAANKLSKAAQDQVKNTEKLVKDYDKIKEDAESLADELKELTEKEIQIKITKFNMQVEIRLDLRKAEQEWNEFVHSVMQRPDIFRDANSASIVADSQYALQDATSYFTSQSIQSQTSRLRGLMNELNQMNKTGTSDIYGNDRAALLKDLDEATSDLMNDLSDFEDKIDEVKEAYLDTIDDIDEQFSKQIEDYEFIGELLQHDMDLLTLLYGEQNYAAMGKYYEKLEENNNKQIDSLKKQSDYWKRLWDQARKNGNTQLALTFEEKYKNTIKSLNSLIEQSAQLLQKKYANSVNQIFDNLDKQVTGGKGTQYVEMQWQLMNKNAERYLDGINSAFAIQETERNYQRALNDTKSIKNQQALKKLMDQQIGILANKDKLTQYDVDRAQKVLDIEQARIALEQQQAAKTSMRLKRDSQGNYTYEYVSDTSSIDDAIQKLNQAKNDLYNFDKSAYQQNLNDMLATWKEFQQKYQAIALDTSLSEEARMERQQLLQQQYGELINGIAKENGVVRANVEQDTQNTINDYRNTSSQAMRTRLQLDLGIKEGFFDQQEGAFKKMTDEELLNMNNELIPGWTGGVQQMTEAFTKQNANGESGFLPTCQYAFDQIDQATQDYEKSLDTLAENGGKDLGEIKSGQDQIAETLSDMIVDNADLIAKTEAEQQAMRELVEQALALKNSYKEAYDNAVLALTQAQKLREEEKKRAAQQLAAEQALAKAEQERYQEQQKRESQAAKNSTPETAPATVSPSPTPSASQGGSGGGDSGDNSNGSRGKNNSNSSNDSNDKKDEGYWRAWEATRRHELEVQRQKKQRQKQYTKQSEKANSNMAKQGGFGYFSFEPLKERITGMDSGGYTGQWNNNGKLAFLHQKQLVLNADDTKNILNAVKIMRKIMVSVDNRINDRLVSVNTPITTIKNVYENVKKEKQTVEKAIQQAVKIDATFPNVNSKKEIEQAFNDLINLAAQRTMRK